MKNKFLSKYLCFTLVAAMVTVNPSTIMAENEAGSNEAGSSEDQLALASESETNEEEQVPDSDYDQGYDDSGEDGSYDDTGESDSTGEDDSGESESGGSEDTGSEGEEPGESGSDSENPSSGGDSGVTPEPTQKPDPTPTLTPTLTPTPTPDPTKKAQDVIDRINKIAEYGVDVVYHQDEVTEARYQYECLTETEKTKVTNYDALVAAEKVISDANAKAKAVIDRIKKLLEYGDSIAEHANEVKEVRTAYNSLTEYEKSIVENIDSLSEIEKKIGTLTSTTESSDEEKKEEEKKEEESTVQVGSPVYYSNYVSNLHAGNEFYLNSLSDNYAITFSEDFADVMDEIEKEYRAEHDLPAASDLTQSTDILLVRNWQDILAVYVYEQGKKGESSFTLDNSCKDEIAKVFAKMNPVVRSTQNSSAVAYANKKIQDYIFENKVDAQGQATLEKYVETDCKLLCAIVTASPGFVRESVGDTVSEDRVNVIAKAYSLVGKVGYFWGGKSTVIGMDSEWGNAAAVTAEGSKSTGTMRAFGLDCSGFVTWAVINGYESADMQSAVGDGTSDQWTQANSVSEKDAQPGDFVFQKGPEAGSDNHVGIICGQTDSGDWIAVHCSSSQNGVTVGEAYSASFRYIRQPDFYITEAEFEAIEDSKFSVADDTAYIEGEEPEGFVPEEPIAPKTDDETTESAKDQTEIASDDSDTSVSEDTDTEETADDQKNADSMDEVSDTVEEEDTTAEDTSEEYTDYEYDVMEDYGNDVLETVDGEVVLTDDEINSEALEAEEDIIVIESLDDAEDIEVDSFNENESEADDSEADDPESEENADTEDDIDTELSEDHFVDNIDDELEAMMLEADSEDEDSEDENSENEEENPVIDIIEIDDTVEDYEDEELTELSEEDLLSAVSEDDGFIGSIEEIDVDETVDSYDDSSEIADNENTNEVSKDLAADDEVLDGLYESAEVELIPDSGLDLEQNLSSDGVEIVESEKTAPEVETVETEKTVDADEFIEDDETNHITKESAVKSPTKSSIQKKQTIPMTNGYKVDIDEISTIEGIDLDDYLNSDLILSSDAIITMTVVK